MKYLVPLGVIAIVLAALSGLTAAARAPAENANSSPAGPAAPASAQNFNALALPLDVQSNWSNEGYTFDAQGLAEYAGLSSVGQVLHVNAETQGYDSWLPSAGYGFVDGAYTTDPFGLQTGDAYRLVVNNSDPDLTLTTFVGDVPDAGAVTFALVGSDPGCKINDISIPLGRSDITDADLLANSMGGSDNVQQILRLNPDQQGYDSWLPGPGYGFVDGGYVTEPFEVRIGYPYAVCLKSGADGMTWPE
jgi:hypothetical protein